MTELACANFYGFMAYVDKLSRYATQGEYGERMLPETNTSIDVYLRSAEGQSAVSIWYSSFADTVALLNQFRDEDFHGRRRKRKSSADYETALIAARSAVVALQRRVEKVSSQPQVA